MTAPLLRDYAASTFSGIGTSEVTDDLDWDASDLVVALCITEDNGVTAGTPTVTGLTLSALSGSPTNAANSCKGYGWSATAGGNSNGALTSTLNSNQSAGLSAWAFGNHGGLGGVAVPAPAASAVASLTVQGPDSSVVMILGDWNATTDVTVDTTPAGGTVRQATNVSGNATFLVVEWHNQAAGTRNYGVTNWTGTGTISRVVAEIKGVAGGGTDLPYDGEAKTPLLYDTPGFGALSVASAADQRSGSPVRATAAAGTGLAASADSVGPRSQAQPPARSVLDAATAADQRGPLGSLTPARSALDEAYAADQRAGAPVESTAQAATGVAAAADALGARPVPGLGRSSLSAEMRADSVGGRPAFGLAGYELTGPGAIDLPYDADGLGPRGQVAPARSALDELFRTYPRPALLADTPARATTDLAAQADTRTILTARNLPARVLADQAVTGLALAPYIARGLAQAVDASGDPLPPDVVADFSAHVIRASLEAPTIRWVFGGAEVQGWVP